jgi:excisionase family DNA binding protein
VRRPQYLTVEEAAELLRRSPRSVHELTRSRRIPHRRLPGMRRLLFLADELEAWCDGCQLDVAEYEDGSRVVRPMEWDE